MYGKENNAVQFMFLEETNERSHLRSLINYIYCVEEKDGCFYYNKKLPLTDENDIHQLFVRSFLENPEKGRIKKQTEQHGENISS